MQIATISMTTGSTDIVDVADDVADIVIVPVKAPFARPPNSATETDEDAIATSAGANVSFYATSSVGKRRG